MSALPDQLLYQLKSRGPQAAATLAAACAVSPMGAHKQLQSLLAAGLVSAQDEVQGPGRPKRLWQLTAAGHARFPDRHGDLAVQLILQLTQVLGEPALEQLVAAREAQMLTAYASALVGLRSLGGKVRRLATLRAEEGYLAHAEADGGAWLLIEDHCPICAAARSCQGFCRSELSLFQRCLGPQAVVRREEHLLAGARRCVYRIQPVPRT